MEASVLNLWGAPRGRVVPLRTGRALCEADVAEMFAGPGGWSVACKRAGLRGVGFEWSAPACATATAAGHQRIQMDVRELRDAILRITGLIASPPCQTFTLAGKGTGRSILDALAAAVDFVAAGDSPEDAIARTGAVVEDERTLLVLEPMVQIRDLNPEWVAMEQVPSVMPIWAAYVDALRSLGYSADAGVLQAEQYGVPQTRRRAILVANRTAAVTLPAPTHSRFYPNDPERLDDEVAPWVSMADALGWGMTNRPYPAVAAGTNAGGPDPAAIGGSGARNAIRTEMVAGRWVGEDGYGRNPADWDAYVPQGPIAGRGSIRVTAAEAGVLQSFPADYPWQGTKSEQFQQVGDAIPPLLAEHVIRAAAAMSALSTAQISQEAA